jgi:deoxyribodipyrimidine photo-lyase
MHAINHVVFRFRQDLRVHDNIGLNKAINYALEKKLPLRCVFIFDTTILSQFPRYDQRLWFIYHAVCKLAQELEKHCIILDVWIWDAIDQRTWYIQKHHQCTLFVNNSYGHNASTRDRSIKELFIQKGLDTHRSDDYLLVDRELIPTRKVFTPFYKLWLKIDKKEPTPFPAAKAAWLQNVRREYTESKNDMTIIKKQLIEMEFMSHQDTLSKRRHIDGWKERILKEYTNYDKERNIPSTDWTTQLSPYIRFWLVSVREVFAAAQEYNQIISELAWREFWYHIMYHFPQTVTQAFQEKRREIQRENNIALFQARKEWKTGYALVDAGMRQLLQEWWIHNRVRMVVASFLTKDLLIDRRRWEQHFANYLLDYDRAVNTWNRQWSSSVGADPKPLRIFNPSLQAQRFDPTGAYIKKYCPERKDVPMPVIFDPERYFHLLPYPCIISHKLRATITKERYKEAWVLYEKYYNN